MQRNIKLFMFFNFFAALRFEAPILILYFQQVTGSFLTAMSLFSATMLAGAIFEVPTGIFSDLIGRRKTIILGATSTCVAVVLYALGTSYWMLFAGTIFTGLAQAFYSGNNDALLYDTVADMGKTEEFAHYFGRANSILQFALMIGSLIGGFVATFDFRFVMYLSVFPQIVCFILSWFFIEPHIHKKESTNIYAHMHEAARNLWKNKKLRLLTISQMINFGIGESNWSFRSAFLNTVWPVWALGLYRAFTFGCSTISFWFAGKAIKKFGTYRIMLLAEFYYRTVNFMALFLNNIFSPFIMLTSAPLYGMVITSNTKLQHEEFTNEERATIDSLGSLLGNIVFALFAPILGYLGDMVGPNRALVVGQICMLPIMGINYYLFKKHHIKDSV